MKIAIIGQGYVGRSIAEASVSAGHSVIGFDTDSSVISSLKLNGDYKGTTDASLIGEAEVVVIAVPTPLDGARKPDLSAIKAACKTIIENIKRPVLVINESTSYPGTLRNEIAAVIEKATGLGHLYASSPERVDPGNEKWSQKNTPRLLAGLTPEATAMARKFYSSFCDQIIEVSTPEVAEAAKLFENTFRQVNIALVNEFAQITNALGISVYETLDAANTKPYGFMKFTPSAGVGGHCIPVDPIYLATKAKEIGSPTEIINLASRINDEMPAYFVGRAEEILGDLEKKRVLSTDD
jgi:UDP-N-acetyl-D-glucosamine dehydrogenase